MGAALGTATGAGAGAAFGAGARAAGTGFVAALAGRGPVRVTPFPSVGIGPRSGVAAGTRRGAVAAAFGEETGSPGDVGITGVGIAGAEISAADAAGAGWSAGVAGAVAAGDTGALFVLLNKPILEPLRFSAPTNRGFHSGYAAFDTTLPSIPDSMAPSPAKL